MTHDHPIDPTELTTEDILKESQRRIAERKGHTPDKWDAPERTEGERRLIVAADRFVFWLGRHWLAIINLLALVYVGLPFLTPILLRAGIERPARVIHTIYAPLCHQLPYRSLYLFGEQLTYTQQELAVRVGEDALQPHGYIGDPVIGYKVALCQRDIAIYGAILLAGIAFAPLRRRIGPLPFWAYLLFGIVPVGLDGGIQLVSYLIPMILPSLQFTPLESTPLRRAVTGILFGAATVWFAYPHVEAAFSDILHTLELKFGWER